MTLRRRELLKKAVAGTGWAIAGIDCATFDSCQKPVAARPIRRDVDTLSPNDPIIQAFKSAVTQMKALPSSDPRNWIRQADIHRNFCPHGNWLFLPWHRWYLAYFERICRKLSGMADFALPYWNWTKNPTLPAVFQGGSGNPLFDPTRTIGPTEAIDPAVVGRCVVGQILDDSNFLTFASDSITSAQDQRLATGFGALEATPHNNVHGAIGGNMGRVALSPQDPIFWLHHNMIERCWVEWNLVRNHANTDDQSWTERRFTEFCDEDGTPVDVQVGTGLLLPVVSYQFDDLPTVNPCQAGAAVAMAPGAESWRRLNHPASRADEEALKTTARSGAAVRLDVVRRFGTETPTAASLAQPATVRIDADTGAVRSAAAARATGQRTILRFSGVGLAHTGDFFVKVFIDKPDATARTPESDPHFVGAFGFFDHAHVGHAMPSTGDFHLDASATILRLGLQGQTIAVNVVLTPFPSRPPKTTSLEIGSVEIQVVRDVIERHRR
jgi:tyrosinase